jgi:hypothetical protein
MLVVRSHGGVPIQLTQERWRHIVGRHPEMESLRRNVVETISNSDIIQKGDFGELLAVKLYEDTPLGEKFVIAAYREVNEEDGFVLTAYLARRPSSRRETLWKRQ